MIKNEIIVRHYNIDGKLIYKNSGQFVLSGYENLLKSFFNDVNTPSYFLIDLSTDSSLDINSSTFTPVVGSGYTPQIVNRNQNEIIISFKTDQVTHQNYWEAETKVVSFIAGSNWPTTNFVVMRGVTNNGTYMIGYGEFAIPRQLNYGDRLDTSIILRRKL